MQIVIDIPDRIYKIIQSKRLNLIDIDVLEQAVKDGISLPKGHGRLIDADKTIQKICGSSCGCHLEECGHDEPCFSVTRIESAPTIIKADTESEDKE